MSNVVTGRQEESIHKGRRRDSGIHLINSDDTGEPGLTGSEFASSPAWSPEDQDKAESNTTAWDGFRR